MDTDETKGNLADSPPGTGQASGETPGTTPQTPATHSEAEMQKAVSDALAEAGRKHKAELTLVTSERDTLKGQITTKDSELEDVAEERKGLQSQIDDLTSDDPEKFNLVTKEKDLRGRESTLKAEKRTLEADKLTQQATVKQASDTLREVAIWEIATEYEGGDPVKLKELCDKFELSSREKIQDAAEALWTKKPAPATPPVSSDSGLTSGGSEDFTTIKFGPDAPSAKEMISKGVNKK